MIPQTRQPTGPFWTLLQSCIRNLIAVLLAMTSRPHDLGFLSLWSKRDVKVNMNISAVTVHDKSIPPGHPTSFKKGHEKRS